MNKPYLDKINNSIHKIMMENQKHVSLFDKNGFFAGWFIGENIFDEEMNPIMYVKKNNIWRWEDKVWVGKIDGDGVYRTNGDIVFTLNPSKRLKKKRVTKDPATSTRPPKPISPPRKPIPDRETQLTFKSYFIDLSKI
ncbi:4-fold beta flower protein [Bacteriovorax sp. BAL6_X]|uniref:4-fold beta flower protein n=1 Tax=Bacteriovorax sp. BAL6_X TaxID=1201290 RepID=UPI00059121D3|nr:hypothetical protein [Bacteriovorax sp. BAL6_X]